MEIDPFSLALSPPLDTASGEIRAREGFLVWIERDGVRGVGEATPLPGWTESLADCRQTLEAVAEGRCALAALDPEETPAASHGIELAIADASARAQGVPLANWLAETPARSVPVNATIGDGDVAETVEAAQEAATAGYETLKIKVGARSLAADYRRIDAVSEAVPAVELRLDANGAWSRADARAAIDRFAPLEIEYVEQPLSPSDLDGHAALRGGGVGIALDESIRRCGIDSVLRANAADVVILKPMAIGGIQQTRDIAFRAREHGVDPVVTTTIDGVVGRTAALHLAASLEIERACGLATADRLADDLAPDPAPVKAGRITVPTELGVGVTPERD